MRKTAISIFMLAALWLQSGPAQAQKLFIPATDYRHYPTVPADSLTPEQYARAKHLAGLLMAPCCYAKTAAEDQSSMADQVKQQARLAVKKGYSDDQILAGFASVYGEKILARPTTEGFNKMVWIMPFVALLVGAAVYYRFMRGNAAGPEKTPARRTPRKKAKSERDEEYMKRIDHDLEDFE